MNVKQLIERIECLKNIFGNKNEYVKIDMVVELLSELDEPQKVTIPQFVADAIEGARELSPELEDAFNYVWSTNERDFDEWYSKSDNRELFARAWLDGYEVEKEKQYFVKIRATKHCFTKDGNGRIFFSLAYKSCFTQTELEKAGFGWVFDCEGIEVKEVEE